MDGRRAAAEGAGPVPNGRTSSAVRRIGALAWASDARLVLPGSKSVANRALVAAALSGSRVLVEGATPCDDVRHLVAGLAALGYEARFEDEARGRVCVGPRAANAPNEATLRCGNAGTATRFLVSVAAVTPGRWTIDGDDAMRRRPIAPLTLAWRALGIDIDAPTGCPPVTIVGGLAAAARRDAGAAAGDGRVPARVRLDASLSSQFLSSLLLVASTLEGGLEVDCGETLASIEYAHLSIEVLRAFGVRAELDGHVARVASGSTGAPTHYSVQGDWSAMGVWTCLNELSGSHVVGENLASGTTQADERLAQALAAFRRAGDEPGVGKGNGDHDRDHEHGAHDWDDHDGDDHDRGDRDDRDAHAGRVGRDGGDDHDGPEPEGVTRTLDVSAFPDQFMNLAVVAAFQPGSTELTGAANLRVKECDRIAVTARELARVGVTCEEQPDGLRIHGPRFDAGGSLRSARIDPEADHRVAMAFALFGLLAPPGVELEIADPACVAKSYPTFWTDLERVRAEMRCICVIGMRGAGKTTFARALAERTGCRFVDSDAELERRHGPIATLVERDGWPAFRAREAARIAELLADGARGTILALGGGALEDARTRELVRERTLPMWLDTPLATLRARLGESAGARPSLTGAPLLDELADVLRAREPIFRSLAAVHLDGEASTKALVERALTRLRPGASPSAALDHGPGREASKDA